MAETLSATRVYDVVVADDDMRVREALGDLIEDHAELHLVASVGSGRAAARACASLKPPLAVVDVMMDCGGDAAVVAIHRVSPGTKVIAYTARSDRRTRERLLAAGAVDVLVKGRDLDLADVLHQIVTA